jgi:hypothetical protein
VNSGGTLMAVEAFFLVKTAELFFKFLGFALALGAGFFFVCIVSYF